MPGRRYVTRRVDSPAAEQQHSLAEQLGSELGELGYPTALGGELEQSLDAGQRQRIGSLSAGQCLADEGRKQDQHRGARRVRRRNPGSVAEQLCQIEQPRPDSVHPLLDALAADAVSLRDLLERLAAVSRGDCGKDIVDAVDLAGESFVRQRTLPFLAFPAADEPERDLPVAVRGLQPPLHRCFRQHEVR